MKVALINFFPYRPHSEHMYYLGLQLKSAGHKVVYLSCRGGLKNCYNLSIKGDKPFTCNKCRIGGFRSYVSSKDLRFVDDYIESINPTKIETWQTTSLDMVKSSSYTLTRVERPEDIRSEKVNSYQKALTIGAKRAFFGVRKFLEKESIDFAFIFNGRMDVLRAAVEAAKVRAVPFACVERTWFGHGIQLNFSANSLSLKELRTAASRFQNFPLSRAQATKAASFVLSRFLKTNELEWRKYNEESVDYGWPHGGEGRKKILILPLLKMNNFLNQIGSQGYI